MSSIEKYHEQRLAQDITNYEVAGGPALMLQQLRFTSRRLFQAFYSVTKILKAQYQCIRTL